MKLKKMFWGIFFLCALSTGYAQKNFEGTVVQQRYIRLEFKSPVILQESSIITVSIKRLELGRYLIPYWGVERFIRSLDVESARTVFEATLESDSSGSIFQYEDHAVKQGRSYIYWLQSPSGKIIAGPLCRKVRDPKVWWSQEKIELTMDRLARIYPNVVEKYTFGNTREGNPINGLLVGNLNNAIVLIGQTHAGESGPELHLYTIEQILTHNRDLLNEAGIIIIPVLNIDSRNLLINGIPDYQRVNIRGVDLNRNYPSDDWEVVDSSYGSYTNDPFSGTYRGPFPASEPETKTVIRMIETYKPKVVFDYHWMGCITGCNLLAYKKPEVLPEFHQYAECFYEGFYENTKNPPKYGIGKSTKSGTTHRYCITKHNIPGYSVEGNKQDPVLSRAHSDMASEEDLLEYQQKHYRAILNVLQYLSRTTD